MYIGKMTLDGYFNYGNLLQNYALQQVLMAYGEVVETIWHTKDNFLPRTWWQWGWKEPVKFLMDWRGYRTNILTGHVGREMVRQGKLRDWADRYICFRYGVERLESIRDEYDFFVVGSDQVWNPLYKGIDENFLSFAPKEKRISYAASISCPEIPAERRGFFQQGLSGMSNISLREQEGADLVKELIGKDVPVHVDPTLLLTPEDWRKVNRSPAWYHGGAYILTYFLGKRPEVVASLEATTGLPVVNLLDEEVYEHYVTGVDEFLWAIEHASLVYTDSFHGTVFSILFRRPFVVCDRVGNSTDEKMGSRIDTLLGYFGLEDRRGTQENGYRIPQPLSMPDWSEVEPVLEKERKRSEAYLREALSVG